MYTAVVVVCVVTGLLLSVVCVDYVCAGVCGWGEGGRGAIADLLTPPCSRACAFACAYVSEYAVVCVSL
jgi:hypothetical protein